MTCRCRWEYESQPQMSRLWLNSTHSKSLPFPLAYSALSTSFHSHAEGILLHSTTTSNANEGTPSQQTTNESNTRKRARERWLR